MKTLKLSGNTVTIPIDRATGECTVDADKQRKDAVKAALDTVRVIADAIRSLGSVPSGTLYANVMSHMVLATYDQVIQTLKNCGLVTEAAHVLTWAGPKLEDGKC